MPRLPSSNSQDLAARGIKIRTRALSTTLFARLLLSDLFLHGIGGAKYDQVTNQIAEQFFGFALPEFAAVSATLRLPICCIRIASDEQSADLRQQLRELDYHPERFLDNGDSSAANGIAPTRSWPKSGVGLHALRRRLAYARHMA